MITCMPLYRCNVDLWELEHGEEHYIQSHLVHGRLGDVWDSICQFTNRYFDYTPKLQMQTMDVDFWSEQDTKSGSEGETEGENDEDANEKFILDETRSKTFNNVPFKELNVFDQSDFEQLAISVDNAEDKTLLVWVDHDLLDD